MRRVVAATRAAGKIPGFMATNEAWAQEYWRHGFRMMAFGLDHLLFQAALKSGLDRLRAMD